MNIACWIFNFCVFFLLLTGCKQQLEMVSFNDELLTAKEIPHQGVVACGLKGIYCLQGKYKLIGIDLDSRTIHEGEMLDYKDRKIKWFLISQIVGKYPSLGDSEAVKEAIGRQTTKIEKSQK